MLTVWGTLTSSTVRIYFILFFYLFYKEVKVKNSPEKSHIFGDLLQEPAKFMVSKQPTNKYDILFVGNCNKNI